MKTNILDKTGKKKGGIELPKNFSGEIRQDILQKAYEVEKKSLMAVWGAKPGAGAQYSASGILKHRRHAWKTTYGKGISRIPRKIFSRSGSSFNWEGATVSNTRGGRNTTAPKAIKNLIKKINKKEWKIAFDSAFAGAKGKIVFDGAVLELKTKEFLVVLRKSFGEDYEKVLKKKSIRAGKGKSRGRKYKSNAGLLFIVSSKEEMKRSGIEVVKVNELALGDLTLGGQIGRLVCFSEDAVKEIGEVFK